METKHAEARDGLCTAPGTCSATIHGNFYSAAHTKEPGWKRLEFHEEENKIQPKLHIYCFMQ